METLLLLGGVSLFALVLVERGPGSSAEAVGTDPQSGLPASVMTNNPGNIHWTVASAWQGETGQGYTTAYGEKLEVFTTPQYGARAMIKLIQNKVKAGHNTLPKLTASWAAANTDAYAAFVASATAIPINAALDPYDVSGTLVPVAWAMAQWEAGGEYFDLNVFSAGGLML